MPVFKAYFQVLRASRLPLSIYLAVFLGLSILFQALVPGGGATRFEPSRTPLVVINEEPEEALAQGLATFLESVGQIKPTPSTQEGLQDALFYRTVEYIAIIPAGFSQAFLSGAKATVQKVIVPNSTSSYYVDLNIDKFLNTVRMHRLFGDNQEPRQLIQAALDDLALETEVILKSFGASSGPDPDYSYYFRYSAYALLGTIVAGIGSVMISFNQADLYLRNLSAPLPQRRANLQLLAGHGVFAGGFWLLLILVSAALYGQRLLGSGVMGLYLLNTLTFTAVCVSIGFLLGGTVKSYNALSGFVQVIALGLNFLGGVFVPQEVMSQSVFAIAQLLPSYWFVKAHDLITRSGTFPPSLPLIFRSILIQAGFAIALTSWALFLSKEQRMSRFA